ncbi:MAG TPA: Rid family hydrolase [Mucilaginibacter sp.]|nr:Rid family hydrolase [Mucilaginibacter sp.]
MATAQNIRISKTKESEKIVKGFFQIVRSGREPERAAEFMADTILAHQMNSENPETIRRTPQNYANHIKEFLAQYGQYDLVITELIGNKDKVYVRWKQTGKHLQDIDGHKATNLRLIEVGSAVYRIKNGKIADYWLQLDRQGFELQLQQNEKQIMANQPNKLPFSEAVATGGTLYISGQIGSDSSGQLAGPDFKAEADQVMKNLGGVLKSRHLGYQDLVSVTIYLTLMDNYSATNEVYKKYFNERFPARVCIAVKELPMNARIEIAGIAQIKSN